MTPQDGDRKRLRVGHASERGGINAVRGLLESHELVVDEVSGRNDYGRDLHVDLTKAGQITGVVIGVQVKGDRRFIRPGDWELPVTPKDRRFWAESSVPIIGVLWDPDSQEMRWTNLSDHARTDSAGNATVSLPPTQRLTAATIPGLVEEMLAYVRRAGAATFLRLFDPDDEQRCHAIDDCWAVGRQDPRAFILMRRALPGLQHESLRRAIVALGHLTPHPDIFWHSGNWIPPEIEEQVEPSFRWTPHEVHHMVQAVEDQGGGWERGGIGQYVWSLLVMDRDLRSLILPAMTIALDHDHLDAAFQLLVIHQYLARSDPEKAIRHALGMFPQLQEHPLTDELIAAVKEHGHIDVY